LVAGISQCYQHIADESVAPDTLDRRSGKHLPEALIVQFNQIEQPRCSQFCTGQKIRLPRRLCELVPRADGKAIVAPIDPIPH